MDDSPPRSRIRPTTTAGPLARLVPRGLLALTLALAACADGSSRGDGPSVGALRSMISQDRLVTRGYITVGDRAEKGENGPRDPARAAHWYQRAADGGDPSGMAKLGTLYVRGDGVPRDPERAAELFRQASAMGNNSATAQLGSLYVKGDGVPRDPTEAARLFREAAVRGHSSAMFQLGTLYVEGKGVPQDLPYGHGLWRLAAEKGHAGARDRVAKLDVGEEELARSAQLAEQILNGRR